MTSPSPGNVDSAGAHTSEVPAPAGASEPLWQDAALAPMGLPVTVRDTSGQSCTAIRDPYCLWYNEDRSGGLAFIPTEFSPLP